ncbi:hypothetical protein EZ449_01765 [Pedobacter frigidisoli]|uniref:DUF4190 domain-containing protein n=1 Tax=Pedobacter frigidisoli TaxID=2530455 RepID=A0A4R0P9K8_9SPHI|nr:hypothetical protein [Pedobacter frigidisoli]TCD12797.1 hypothetical protein EZ449_01765 [Pedobacter frigidisoli]
MKIAGLIIGILAILGMILAFIPCIGALNWINIPFAVLGLIFSILGLNQDQRTGLPKGTSIAGIIMCAIAIFFGLIRLILGGGII